MLDFNSVVLNPSQGAVSNSALGAKARGVCGIFFDREEVLLERSSGYLEFDNQLPMEVGDHQRKRHGFSKHLLSMRACYSERPHKSVAAHA